MASTSHVQTTAFGNLRVTYGFFTANAADANMTITVAGGQVFFASFTCQDAAPTPANIPWDVPYSVSSSGSTSTLTVYTNGATTNGRFIIISA